MLGHNTVAALSVAADDDDFGVLSSLSVALGIGGSGAHATRVAAPGTIAVDETRGIGLQPSGKVPEATPVPTRITGA